MGIGKLRILVVDDDQDTADALAILLRRDGHEVQTALDAHEALRLGMQGHPQMILLDVGLGAVSGWDAARLIRGEPWGRDLLLVALTGWGQPEDHQRSKEAGFDHHLVKPVEMAELRRLIREAHG